MGRGTELRPGGGRELAGRRRTGARQDGGGKTVPGRVLELVHDRPWHRRGERGGRGDREAGQQPDPEGHRTDVVRKMIPVGEWIGPFYSSGERDADALLTEA